MLTILDKAFFVFHSALIAFNLVGWAFRRVRALHRVTVLLTALSWFVLGAFYGWGYCLCTDWHFQARRELGYVDPETSYVQLLARVGFGVSMSQQVADGVTAGLFAAIVMATLIVWRRDRRVQKRIATGQD
jgi:hypothetical protein